jgi:AcrR family transcriptional regulator
VTKTQTTTEPAPVDDQLSQLTPRALRTRAALVQAARVIFERDGYHNARITDIADEAGVAHGTFYTYFTSKTEAFLALAQQLLEDALAPIDAPLDKSLNHYERLEHYNREYLAMYREWGRIIALWEEVTLFDQVAAELLEDGLADFAARSAAQIKHLQEEKLADPRIDPRYAANALTGMIHRFAYRWFSQGRGVEFDFDEAVVQISRLWANAIGLQETPHTA